MKMSLLHQVLGCYLCHGSGKVQKNEETEINQIVIGRLLPELLLHLPHEIGHQQKTCHNLQSLDAYEEKDHPLYTAKFLQPV